MADNSTSNQQALVIGANHRSSSMGLRDRLFMEDVELPTFLDQLKQAGIDQAVVLSTCDRVEVQTMNENPDGATSSIRRLLAERGQVSVEELGEETYVHQGEEAVRQIFAVTAALDSLIVGEPQVLGQVKAGHRLARDAGMVGGGLEAILQAAYSSAKRVRTETGIGERPVSIAASAADLVSGLHGNLARVSAVLVGVGEMGEMIAGQMLADGLGHLVVTHPSPGRAATMARTLDCHHGDYERLAELLTEGDAVICALGSREHAVTADVVRAALRQRRKRPMFIIDTAVPGDVEPAVNRIDEAFVYDMGDLEQVALEGRAGREQEAQAAWRIVEDEVDSFLRGRAERAAAPAVSQLRAHVEALRDDVLAEAGNDAEKATRLLVSRLLHAPSEVLRRAAAEDKQGLATAETVIRQLFELTGDDPGGGKEDEE